MTQQLIDREAVLRECERWRAYYIHGSREYLAILNAQDAIASLPVETAQATSAERQSTIETLRRADLDAMVRALDADEKVATTGNKDHDNIEALIASLLRAQQQATSTELLNFLYGSGPLDGVWFGESHPTESGAFWWRKYLPLLRAPQQQGEPKP